MTKLMTPFRFPTLLPFDIFDGFDTFFKDQDYYNRDTKTLSMKKFPKGDIFVDEAGNRVIELALAGYGKEQLSVTVENGMLIVAAEKCDGGSDQQRTLARRSFRQVFSNFGENLDLENADVVYKDGLLRIVVPSVVKKDEVKTLTIK